MSRATITTAKEIYFRMFFFNFTTIYDLFIQPMKSLILHQMVYISCCNKLDFFLELFGNGILGIFSLNISSHKKNILVYNYALELKSLQPKELGDIKRPFKN
jgi:hypothetical protein